MLYHLDQEIDIVHMTRLTKCLLFQALEGEISVGYILHLTAFHRVLI